MVEHQGPRRRAVCEIEVDGQIVTQKLNPYLISVQVIDSAEGSHSQCNIELDDRNGELQVPPDGVALIVRLGWAGEGPRVPDTGRVWKDTSGGGAHGQEAQISVYQAYHERSFGGPGIRQVFGGQVSSVESGFGRKGGGRRMWIEATSGNVKGMTKETMTKTWGGGEPADDPNAGKGPDIPLSQVMDEIFSQIGVTVKLSPMMAAKMRKHWHIVDESPQAFGQRLAKELGGIFKIDNNVASLVGADEGVNADGLAMPEIEAVWGVNLIGWRIKPYAGRPQYGAAASRFFNLHTGKWESLLAIIPGDDSFFSMANAVINAAAPVANKEEAADVNAGNSSVSQNRRGTGWVLLNGEPTAEAGGFVTIIDARPGVDARYVISEAEHNYTRGVGYTTRCNVKNPTPNYEKGKNWTRGPGRYDSTKPQQSTDPNAPNYVPPAVNHTDPSRSDYTPPPEPKPGEKQFTEAEKEAFRAWYRKNQKPYPNWLIPKNAQRVG